jgi:hypothetical protein
MADILTSREFALAAACCRWPRSERTVAVRHAAEGQVDWRLFLRLIERHRIEGLVHDALASADLKLPPPIRSALAAKARQIAQRNLALAAETMRLQAAFASAGIPVLVLKGAALAHFAYGTLSIKQGRDVDLLVPPDFALHAFRLIESLGYRFALPAKELGQAQRRGLVRYGNEAEFVEPSKALRADLHWQLAYNPALLKGVGVQSPARAVEIAGFGTVHTLGEADGFSYLCVHGAYHRWSRLKWLADLNASISDNNGAELRNLYGAAQVKGAGLCAAQALLLAHRLLGLNVPAELMDKLRADRRATRLVAIALRGMAAETSRDLSLAGHFLLGEGPAYFGSQMRIAAIGLPDVIRFPLPAFLHFLYPGVRLPLSIWRRAKRAMAGKRRADHKKN